MAKIEIVANTDKEKHDLQVKIDGETIENVGRVEAYRYGDGVVEIEIVTRTIADNGVSKTVRYYSAGSKKASEIKDNAMADESTIAGFIGIETEDDLATQLWQFLTNK